jgi:hypothetical protein
MPPPQPALQLCGSGAAFAEIMPLGGTHRETSREIAEVQDCSGTTICQKVSIGTSGANAVKKWQALFRGF